MDHTFIATSFSRPKCYPLPPQETASLECLLHRLQPIYDKLLKRGFSDAAASQAVDEVLKAGCKALASGKAARMSAEQRAGWLWTVALNAARKAAVAEPTFVSLMKEPVARTSESDYDQPLLEALRGAIENLPVKQMEAIKLHGLQGLSLRETARMIGVSPATVAYRYSAGLTRLASAIKTAIQAGHCEKPFGLLAARLLCVEGRQEPGLCDVNERFAMQAQSGRSQLISDLP